MNKLINLILSVIIFSSCSDILDIEPDSQISDGAVIVDVASAEKALIGVYDAAEASISNVIVTFNNAGDNVVRYDMPGVILPNLTPTGTDGGSGGTDMTNGSGYSSQYVTINRANQVIKAVNTLPAGAARDKVLAEAYFLRALSYFDLARIFGGVPVVLDPSFSEQVEISNSTKNQVYAQVESDLEAAEQLFGTNNSLASRDRISIWAVYGLIARYSLYNEQWEKAEEYASKLIDNPDFSLTQYPATLPNPYTVVENIEGGGSFFLTQKSSESIFELTFSASDKNQFYTAYLTSGNGGRFYWIVEGSLGDDLKDPAKGGKRTALAFDRETGIAHRGIAEYGKRDGTSSVFVLRLAEQYLIRAEARAQLGNITGAADDLNVIKDRAEVPLLDVTSTLDVANLLLEVENERRYELAFEGHRWPDIIRTGRAPVVFGALNARYNENRYWVFPFPYNAIQKDPYLIQNEAYR